MSKFYFKLNEFKDVCHVFKSNSHQEPFDAIYLMHWGGSLGWVPHNVEVQRLVKATIMDLDYAKDIYNQNYDEICALYFPADLLKINKRISGFYVNYETGTTQSVTDAPSEKSISVVRTHDQLLGNIALCQLSHILEVYREGWKPDWSDDNVKWCIGTVKNEFIIETYIHKRAILSFQTETKAKYFLDKKIDLIVNLSNAGYI
jgi:hypothetical protein